ncbi:MAG: hypothetical protein RSB71_02635 [Bacilli bacterium]
MKKIIILSLFLLVGCTNKQLNNSCILEEKANTLKTSINYTFSFENDILDNINVTYDYVDTDVNNIKAVKLSNQSQNKFFKDVKINILFDTDQHYKIEYLFNNDNKEMMDYFKVKKERTKFVKELKTKGYSCK